MVAPLAGAWIEIAEEKGKKYDGLYVAPLAGAWIEIGKTYYFRSDCKSRSPRGSVD